MAEFNDKIIEMGCDFWIDTEEDAPSVVTRMTGIQPSWATTKGEIFRTRSHKEIPGKFFKQNLWELSGTAYFEKDDHLIPFKSIDMLEMIEKQKSSFQKIFRNYKYKCLLHFCYVNRHKLQFRIPPELWRRIAPYGLLVDFDLYLFSNSKKNNINRIKAGTEMGCTLYIETGKNDPGIVTEMTGISPTRIKRKGYPDIPYTEPGTHPVFDEKNVWFYDTFDNRKASKYFDLVYQSNEILDLVESRLESFRKVFRRFKNSGLILHCSMGHYNFQFRIRPDMWKRIAKLNIPVDFYLYYISTPYFND